jgi:hypothetical protein
VPQVARRLRRKGTRRDAASKGSISISSCITDGASASAPASAGSISISITDGRGQKVSTLEVRRQHAEKEDRQAAKG